MSEKIVQLNEETIKGQIKELSHDSVGGDTNLLKLSRRALDDHLHRQGDRAVEPGNPPHDPSGGNTLMSVCNRLRHAACVQLGNKKHANRKHLESATDDAYISG